MVNTWLFEEEPHWCLVVLFHHCRCHYFVVDDVVKAINPLLWPYSLRLFLPRSAYFAITIIVFYEMWSQHPLISLTTENTENKTTPKICKITVPFWSLNSWKRNGLDLEFDPILFSPYYLDTIFTILSQWKLWIFDVVCSFQLLIISKKQWWQNFMFDHFWR